jgi:hypothetical protein
MFLAAALYFAFQQSPSDAEIAQALKNQDQITADMDELSVELNQGSGKEVLASNLVRLGKDYSLAAQNADFWQHGISTATGHAELAKEMHALLVKEEQARIAAACFGALTNGFLTTDDGDRENLVKEALTALAMFKDWDVKTAGR